MKPSITAQLDRIPTDADSVTPVVLRAMENTADPRLRSIIESLVTHLHAFVRETQLTDEEFERGIEFLVAIGHASGAKKNEGVLLADILGVSTLVSMLNNKREDEQTASALLGPFWRAAAPICAPGDNIARGATEGVPLSVMGRVTNVDGQPIAGVCVDVWQAAPSGYYECQDASQPDMNLRGRFETDAQGRYYLKTVRPAGYPVPTDGPCGDLLRAQKRHPYRPAHLHFMLSMPGYRTLITQVFADDAEHLNTDVVFAVVPSLVGDFAETIDAGGKATASLEYDFVLQRGERKFPIPPIP